MNKSIAQGFTLIELMVTVAVLAVVLGLGVPSFQEMIQNNRISANVNEMVTDINLARSEAVKRGSPVTFCKRNTAGSDCDGSATWISGWIVFVDGNGDGTVDTPGDVILRIHGAPTGLTSLNFSRNRITYSANGFATGYTGTLTFCDSRGVPKARGLVLSNNGRLRTAISSDTLTCP